MSSSPEARTLYVRRMQLAALAALALAALPAAAAEPDPVAAPTTPTAAATAAAAPAGAPTAPPPAPATVAAQPAMIQLPGGMFLLGEPIGPVGEYSGYVRVRPFLLDATASATATARIARTNP